MEEVLTKVPPENAVPQPPEIARRVGPLLSFKSGSSAESVGEMVGLDGGDGFWLVMVLVGDRFGWRWFWLLVWRRFVRSGIEGLRPGRAGNNVTSCCMLPQKRSHPRVRERSSSSPK